MTDKKDPHPELAELHKKLLMMERNRKQQQDETEKIIRKQESRIEELKNEQRALKHQLQDLDQTQRPYSAFKKTESSKDLDEKIENEKKKDRELTLNIKTFKEEILKKRKILGGINAAQENYAQIQKQIKILENRLDKANQKFNEAISQNKKLREEIDALRRERVIFDNIQRKLEKELHERRKEMANIIEDANQAQEERDQKRLTLEKLKKTADLEKRDFEEDFKRMERQIHRAGAMDELWKSREEENLPKQEQEQEQSKKTSKMERKATIAKDKEGNFKTSERVQQFEEEFAKIQSATQIENIDELVRTFIASEDKNFTLFKFVNELSADVEYLQNSKRQLENEIEVYKNDKSPEDNNEQQRRGTLQLLEEKLTKTEAKSTAFELKQESCQKNIQHTKQGVERFYKILECDTIPIDQTSLGNQGVTEYNIMIYLGLIEQRITEIMAATKNLEHMQLATKKNLHNTSHAAISNVMHMFTHQLANDNKYDREIKLDYFPSMNNDDEDKSEDDDAKPMTMDQWKEQANEKWANKNKVKKIKSTKNKY